MGNYRQLAVWQRSFDLVLRLYRATASFPGSERYGLTDQLRRAAASVPLNIAEGTGRSTPGELRRFLRIARGSTNEVTCQLLLAQELGYLDPSSCAALIDASEQVGAMISGWLRTLDRQLQPPPLTANA